MSKPKILIVDDEPDVIALIARTLEGEGFDVVYAYDGISALTWCRSRSRTWCSWTS